MPSNLLRSANDLVADAFLAHQLSLLRVADDLRRPVLAELERLEASLAAEAATLPEATNPRRLARMNALLGQTRASIAAAYKIISQTTQDGLIKLAGIEQRKANAVVNSALGTSPVEKMKQAIRTGHLAVIPRPWQTRHRPPAPSRPGLGQKGARRPGGHRCGHAGH